MPVKARYLTRTIWVLSLVSLFTDVASEMIYPILPVYLQSIGYSFAFIGVLEGVAEATAGLSKGFFGRWSDQIGKRLPFVRLGYALSALSRPLLAVWTHPAGIFSARTADRFGKGIRTAARDALLAQEASPEHRGAVFGFHRSMDTLGAVFGPLLALGFLFLFPGQYVWLLFLTFIPGLISVFLTFLISEKPVHSVSGHMRIPSLLVSLSYVKSAPKPYKKILIGLIFFALFNSSDMFLLLRVKSAGYSDYEVIGFYILFNLSYVLLAWPVGILSDRVGKKFVTTVGFLIFSLVYALLAMQTALHAMLIAFVLYGGFYACTEGVARAWISDIIPHRDLATAIGAYTALQSISLMLASSLAGLIWQMYGPVPALFVSACAALLVSVYFSLVMRSNHTGI
ncbi:MFS-type transporter involved in bile tolerance (Atg22 family) [Schleiferia thermophila]|uniref:MFS-type transporter involved in bile tolerance (Atg22 family) n=1 Tax=Schleiferia thermophila TaxID=884107 RepID=A0A368ZYA4_9FLAO|nr:MFS-type transporter involved in bile tolerance (Atg22 family) [Schleiferia thermophila]